MTEETGQTAPAESAAPGPEDILVGMKPSMAYVMAAMTQFNAGRKEVRLKARGKAIVRCVDVAEIIRRRFLPNARCKDIRIGSEEVTSRAGRKVNISTMEIVLGTE